MEYVVNLYIEGGEHDGETRVLGPTDESSANAAADELAGYGTVDVYPLATSVEEVLGSLGSLHG